MTNIQKTVKAQKTIINHVQASGPCGIESIHNYLNIQTDCNLTRVDVACLMLDMVRDGKVEVYDRHENGKAASWC